MKNIHLILLVLSSIVIPGRTYGQLFIGGSYSYLTPSFQEELGDGNFESAIPGDTQQFNSVARYSYGRGHEASLKLGYKTKKNFVIGIDFSRLQGTESMRTLKFTAHSRTTRVRANTFRIGPYVQATFPISQENKLHLYIKFGGVLGLSHRTFDMSIQENLNNSTLTERKNDLTSGSSFGITGGIGVQYQITERLYCGLGFKVVAHNYSPNQSEVTTYIINGEDQLSSLTIRDRVTEFHEKIFIDYNSPPANDAFPIKVLKTSLPFGGMGVEFSIQYMLSE